MMNELINSVKKYRILYFILSFIVLYSPFFGYSYLKGRLSGSGFTNSYINVSVQETVFQTGQAIQNILNRLLNSDIFSQLFDESLKIGVTVFIVLILLGIAFRTGQYFIDKSATSREVSLDEIAKKIAIWFFQKPFTIAKTIIIATISALVAFCAQFIVSALIIIGLTLVWITMSLGNTLGISVGREYVDKDICKSYKFKEGQKKQIGCNKITLTDGTLLTGLRIYKTEDTTYFVTNDGAYEIDTNKNLINFSPIHKNPNTDEEQKLKPEET